ncbi:MAG: hypothetical protein ACPGN3_08745 [Opitutales bacterium]
MGEDTFVHIQDSTGTIRVVHLEEPRLSVLIKPTYDTDGCVTAGTIQKVIYHNDFVEKTGSYAQIVSAAESFFNRVNKADCFAFSRWKTCPYPQEHLLPPGR